MMIVIRKVRIKKRKKEREIKKDISIIGKQRHLYAFFVVVDYYYSGLP